MHIKYAKPCTNEMRRNGSTHSVQKTKFIKKEKKYHEQYNYKQEQKA